MYALLTYFSLQGPKYVDGQMSYGRRKSYCYVADEEIHYLSVNTWSEYCILALNVF